MGKVVKFRRHARASSMRKSSGVTRFSVTDLTATAKSFDSHVFPRLNRDTVVRSQGTPIARIREAIASSSKPSTCMNSDNCMVDNVHTMHSDVNGACAFPAIEPATAFVHNAHMAKGAGKQKTEEPHTRVRNKHYLRQYREALELSQEEAAARMGYAGHSTLSRIEAGKVGYTQTFLERASSVYGVSIWHLLYCPPGTSLKKALEIWTASVE